MAQVTITMQVDITRLFALYNTVPTPAISTMNASLGTIITHVVTGGSSSLQKGYTNGVLDSTKDTISVYQHDAITWNFVPVNLPPNTPTPIPNNMKCTFVNMDTASKPLSMLGGITQANDPSTSVPGQKLITATANTQCAATDYAVTFTIGNHQLTFDPKMIVHMPSPM